MNVRLIYLAVSLFFSSSLIAQTDSFDKKYRDHFGNVEVATFSMNGKLFATAGWDNMINVYSGDSLEMVSSLYGHEGAVTSVSIARNNKMIVSGSKDRKVNLWTWSDDDETFVLDSVVTRHNHPVAAVVMGPGMRTIFSAATDGEIRIHNLKYKKHKVIKHPTEIHAIALSNDRQKIFVADVSANITVYNPFGKVITTYEGHTDQVNDLAVARNNRYVISASSDKSLIVWDIIKGKEVQKLTGHDWKVHSVDVSFDSKYMVSGSIDGECILWNMETWEQIKSFNVSNGQIKSVAISPNKEYIVGAVAFEDLPEFGETGGVVWKTGYVAPKKKARPPKAPRPTTAKPKTTTPTSATKTNTNNTGTSKVIKKDEQVEISIE